MSFFDDASLAFLPSSGAGKDGKAYSIKPTTGDGDFTFSRGSNLAATRVGPTGLIEKGRENLLLQSNQFDTTWTTLNASVTSGQSGYDGSSDAWLLNKINSDGYLRQNVSGSLNTFSAYVKKGTLNWVRLGSTTFTLVGAFFDLSNGVVGSSNNLISSKIESIGNGWYRCSITLDSNPNSVRVFPADSDGVTSGTSGSIYIQDAQLEIGLAATDVISTGATTGKAGLLEDEPRFDYSGGATCPSLLLEPSRTQLIKYSEYFDASYWNKEYVTITNNAAISPEGVNNSTKLVENATNQRHRIYTYITTTSGTNYTFSVFVKKNSIDRFLLINAASAFGARSVLNLDTLEITNINGTSGKVENFSNGWYRFSISGQATTSSNLPIFVQLQNAAIDSPYLGNGSSLYLYGAQLEEGSYPTSYIPNHSGGSVTRGAVDFFASGLSAVAGQTEGTILLDYEKTNSDNVSLGGFFRMTLSDNSNNNIIYFGFQSNENNVTIVSEGVLGVSITNNNSGQTETRVKIAIAYADNDFEMYYNGTQVGVDTSGAVPINMSRIDFGVNRVTTTKTSGKINQMLLFPTRLSSADLETLTTL